jgi:divalent metal cation (Fe/Co/Zn/Cd) transporter
MPIRDSLRETSRVFWVILFLNLLVAAAKIVYGLLSGAIAITADGVHSVLDGSSNVIGLVGVRIASRPPDPEHPYGHRKLETFAALSIAVLSCCWPACESSGPWSTACGSRAPPTSSRPPSRSCWPPWP